MSFDEEMAEFARMTGGIPLIDPLDLIARAALTVEKHRHVSRVPRMEGGLLVVDWIPTDIALHSVLGPVEESAVGFLAMLEYDPAAMPPLFEDSMEYTREADASQRPLVPYTRVTQALVAANEHLLAVPAIADRAVVLKPAFRRPS